MPEFPKINDKFYSVGQRCGSLRRAIETIQQVQDAADKAAFATPPAHMNPGDVLHRPDYRAIEANCFSVMVGFLDGIIARIPR